MEIGLVTSSAPLCVSCLTICMLEMPHVMARCVIGTIFSFFVGPRRECLIFITILHPNCYNIWCFQSESSTTSVDFLKRGQTSFTFENRVFQSWMSEILLRRMSTYFGVFPFNLLRPTGHWFIRASTLNGIHPKELNNFTEEVLGDTPRIIIAPFFVIWRPFIHFLYCLKPKQNCCNQT